MGLIRRKQQRAHTSIDTAMVMIDALIAENRAAVAESREAVFSLGRLQRELDTRAKDIRNDLNEGPHDYE